MTEQQNSGLESIVLPEAAYNSILDAQRNYDMQSLMSRSDIGKLALSSNNPELYRAAIQAYSSNLESLASQISKQRNQQKLNTYFQLFHNVSLQLADLYAHYAALISEDETKIPESLECFGLSERILGDLESKFEVNPQLKEDFGKRVTYLQGYSLSRKGDLLARQRDKQGAEQAYQQARSAYETLKFDKSKIATPEDVEAWSDVMAELDHIDYASNLLNQQQTKLDPIDYTYLFALQKE